MLGIGAPVSGPTRPGVPVSGWTDPHVGDLVKRTIAQDFEYTECSVGEAFDGRVIAVDGAYITVEELQPPCVMELPYLLAEVPTRGNVACASATAKYAKGHATVGTGVIRAVDTTRLMMLVDSVIT